MNDPDVIFSVCWVGFGAAVFASLLYFLTSSGEPPGFQAVPRSSEGWRRYYLRTLVLVCALTTFSWRVPYIHPVVSVAWAISTLLLLGSSVACSRSEPILSRIGLFLSLIVLLHTLLFPAVGLSRYT